MSLFTVIGCGESARNWVRNGVVIGSNDCEKFGKPVDYLVLANAPNKFKDRLRTIKESKAKVLVTSKTAWNKVFPTCEQITRYTQFNTRITGGFIYTSRTTPIMCLSLAIRMGAKQIVMWGVDMVNHHAYRRGTKQGELEIAIYNKFIKQAGVQGIKIWRGAEGTVFDNTLPLWTIAQ